MLKLVVAVISALFVLCVAQPMYLRGEWSSRSGRKRARVAAHFWKSGATAVAGALAVWGAVIAGKPAMWLIAAGIFLGAVADTVISLSFVGGMGAFLLGHLAFITGFLLLAPLSGISYVAFGVLAVLAAGLFLLLRPLGKLFLPAVVYCAVICAMLACALSVTAAGGGWLFASGAMLFVISDGLLLRNVRFGFTHGRDIAVMTTYYAAQLLLACGVLFGI